jgi:hypothetical protein
VIKENFSGKLHKTIWIIFGQNSNASDSDFQNLEYALNEKEYLREIFEDNRLNIMIEHVTSDTSDIYKLD